MKKFSKKLFRFKKAKLIYAIGPILSFNVIAAPGILQDVPLNLGEFVQPNILFLLDDSGSMDWEVLQSAGARAAFPGNRNSGNVDMTPSANDQEELLESCAGYNVMYFNPSVTYTPWTGVDSASPPQAYGDQPITAARSNPYSTSTNIIPTDTNASPDDGVLNFLTLVDGGGDGPGYIPWNDANNNGDFDPGECGDGGTVAAMYANFVSFASMDAAGQQNFANWYSYYRKREYVAKAALSGIITTQTSRIGLATLHDNDAVGTLIQDMDNISQPSTPQANAAAVNKAALLDNLFRVESAGGTPLRSRLQAAGEYFSEAGSDATVDTLFFRNGVTADHGSETLNASTPILQGSEGGTCQQNFSVVFSDGFWNSDGGFSIDNHDGATNAGEIDGLDGGTFSDTFPDTLADIAMRYYEFDLSATLNDNVRVDDERQDGVTVNHQHMRTYAIAFGVNGQVPVNPDEPGFPAAGWPQPVSDQPTTIDDMRHAAWNGRGEFLNASDPQGLIDSLVEAFGSIDEDIGASSAATFNSGRISAETLVFQSRFNSTDWTGELLAFGFDLATGQINNTPVWNAATALSNQVTSNSGGVSGFDSRNIVINNGIEVIDFEFPANYHNLLADPADTPTGVLNDNQIRDLLTNAPFPADTSDAAEQAANQAFGINIVAYLRGDDSNEQVTDANGVTTGIFRNREGNYLGPTIFSNPQYLGIPSENYPDLIEPTSPYSDFVEANSDETSPTNRANNPLVFVGANDGMLHAFNANNVSTAGNEVFAYIPGLLSNDLHTFSEPGYVNQAYVDGTPTISDVFVAGAWRTFLVGSLRSGGKGVFTLDVTNTTGLSASNVVGEFTHDDLGFTFSRPQIVKMNNGRWAAIFGNGYNNTGDGKAKLFILYLDSLREDNNYTEGTGLNDDFLILETDLDSQSNIGLPYIVNNNCQDAGSDCNGLSSPSLADVDGDAIVDRIYAGDLHGNMWAFDVSSVNPAQWGSAYGTLSNPSPLFIACTGGTSPGNSCGSEADRQPITTKPVISSHPTRSLSATAPNILVYFGTGQYLAEGDNSTAEVQSFYAVWDEGTASGNLDRRGLQQQSFIDNSGVTGVTNTPVIYNENNRTSSGLGWYIDFLSAGSSNLTRGRSVITPLLLGEIVFFVITVPPDSSNTCAGGGDSFLVGLNALDGTQADFPIFDSNDADNVPDNSNPITQLANSVVGINSIEDQLVTTDSLGNVQNQTINTLGYLAGGRKSSSIIK